MYKKENITGPIHIEIIPGSENAIDEQRESGMTHTPFEYEYILYQAIFRGDEQAVVKAIEEYLQHGLVVGMLSGNSLMQIKYWAVACISVAIHYAILGGLDETDAFNLSDQYIRTIDKMNTMEQCIAYLQKKAVELTLHVKKAKERGEYSPTIRKTIHYIHIHLHERLSVSDISTQIGVSREYLSTLFKKETGSKVHTYILREKLEASKTMLQKGTNYDQISYQFGFCSETHYITCFKREYGMTPGEYRKGNGFINKADSIRPNG